MPNIPPPLDSSADHVDKDTGKPTSDFFNWIKATADFINKSVFPTLTVSGDLTVGGNETVGGILTQQATSYGIIATGTTGQRAGTSTGEFRFNTTLGVIEWYDGTNWVQPQKSKITVTRLTSGSGTYNTPAGCVRLRVRMVGAGGGGGAAATNAGANGTDTSFGTWTAIHGTGGASGSTGNPGTGGTGGTNGTGTLVTRIDGADGGRGFQLAGTNSGYGGESIFGGAGGPGGSTAAGTAAKTNTGSGGGAGTNAGSSGGGGAAGEYVEFLIDAPTASYSWVAGAKGNGGTAGTQAGGNGADGIIIVEEYY